MTRFAIGIMSILALTLTACGGGAEVALNFRSADASSQQALQQALSAELEGTNGTLTIDDLWIIVAEVELEAADGACEVVVTEIDDDGEVEEEVEDCESFESGPYFVQVPLDGTAVQAVRETVAYGTYESLEFEVEDISFDEDGEDEEGLQAVADAIAAAGFQNWPEEASMFLSGSYLAAGATEAQPFELYLDAEVEIEMVFPEPLVVDETSGAADVTVDIDPAAWFVKADGTVMDLSQYTPGTLIELEHEVEIGFSGVEIETEIDDGSDDDEGDA